MYNMPENPKLGLVLQIPSHPRRISFASRRAANLPRCVYLISHAEMSKRRTQRRENTHPGKRGYPLGKVVYYYLLCMLLNFVGRAQGDLVVLLKLSLTSLSLLVPYLILLCCSLTLSLSSFRVLWVVWLLVFPYRNTHIYLCISKFVSQHL